VLLETYKFCGFQSENRNDLPPAQYRDILTKSIGNCSSSYRLFSLVFSYCGIALDALPKPGRQS